MTTRPKKPRAPRYRPQLTAEQITHALILAKLDLASLSSTTHEQSLALISTLSPFKAKIDNEAITASYVPTVRKSSYERIASSLGMDSMDTQSTPTHNPTNLAGLTKEQEWELSYNQYTANPANCSALQIEQAKEYMYLNDLMTPEQEEAYELETANAANLTDTDMGEL